MEMTGGQLNLFNKLTELQKAFSLNKLNGMTNQDAYRNTNGKANANSTGNVATDLSKNPNVVKFMDSMRQSIVSESMMTRAEMIKKLTIISRITVSDVLHIVHPTDQLMNLRTGEVISGQSYWSLKHPDDMPEGAMSAITELVTTKQGLKIKLHDQKVAMKQLSDLEGFDKPKQLEITAPKTIEDFYDAVATDSESDS